MKHLQLSVVLNHVRLLSVILSIAVTQSTVAAEKTSIVIPGERFELLTTDVDFAEGPAAGLDGVIYFTDIPKGEKPGRILRFDPKTQTMRIFRPDSGKANGLFVDPEGRLIACEGADFGGRRVSRSIGAGKPETIVDRYQGKRFRAPNDLCVDSKGRIWFSDPLYLGNEPIEIEHKSVYRIEPDNSVTRVITQPQIQKPNGVQMSPDGKTLYVADTNNELSPDGKRGNMQLAAFEVIGDGTIGKKRVLVDFFPETGVDGMTVDVAGNIYAAVRSDSEPSVRVYDPGGREVARIPTPDVPTNCVFGRGDESSRLYITMDHGFGRIRLNATGYHPTADR